VAGRWDGASNINCKIICCLSDAETVGHEFRLNVLWSSKSTGSGVVPATSTTGDSGDIPVATDRSAQYSIYAVDIPIVWDTPTPDIAASDTWHGILRRVAVADGDEIHNEIIILDWVITYQIDKLYKA
jgi:hypothetical protein